jgi:dTMP kinase
MRGKFIVFEGIGASGKDTQMELFEQYLKEKKVKALITREHTRDTPTGILIEKILKKQEKQINPEALQLLFISDRRNHFTKVIEPALNEGKLVIGNRYYAVNVAYSKVEWRQKFLKINKMVVKKPDLVIIIDTPPKVAIERMNKRGDPDIFDQLETMKKCREGYLWYAKNSGDKCVLVDGTGTKEEVFNRILIEINKLNIIKAGETK